MNTTVVECEKAGVEAQVATMIAVPADVRLKVDADAFAAICASNGDLRLELDPDGGLVVMTPAGLDSSDRNMELGRQVANWNHAGRFGKVFDSSGGFTLPNGAVRAPDVSWAARQRWQGIPRAERRRFTPIVPDFVAEVLSPSDSLAETQAKMAEYIAQGVRLGWLIDPDTQTVEVYRPGRDVERMLKPKTLSGEDVMPGLVVDLTEILYDVD